MMFSYILHLILVGLMGIHSKIMTVSNVSVKAGGSISISCLYDLRYRNHVKYLCKGRYFMFCNIVIKTNQPKNFSEQFSIYDDITQTTFTVSINNLSVMDKYYWCGVEIVKKIDDGQRFQLSVTTDMPSLYVDQQEITAFEGGNVTVMCHHPYPEVIKWCRLGTTCVTDLRDSLNSTSVTINTRVPNVFSVTMTEIKIESSGWYLCFNKCFQMPVHIIVHELPSTTMSTNTPPFTGTLSSTHQHSSLLTSTEPHVSQPTNSTIAEAGEESMKDEHNSSTKVMAIITSLVLQLLAVPAAFCGWRMIIRYKNKPEGAVTSEAGSDVLYATIVHSQRVAAQKKKLEPVDGSVIYTTVHTKI